MSGTPSERDQYEPEESEDPHAAFGVLAPKQSFPWQLGLSVFAWLVLGGLLVAASLGVSTTTGGADESQIQQIQGNLGDSSVATHGSPGPSAVWFLLIGLVTLLLALMLLIGQGWARTVLMVLGVAGVILLALGAHVFEAIAAFVLLAAGSILLLNRACLRYLNQ
jgi:hypothetical protein